jgi:flagellar hook-associated protein 1 FlgK
MSGLFSVLHNGARALTAQRVAMATASHNIENVSTEGYTRQRVNLEATPAEIYAPVGMVGTGVRVGSITTARDRFLEARLPAMRGESGSAASRAGALEAITAFDGENGANIAGRLGDFFSALQQLQTRPADLSVRQAALGAANDFTRAVGAAAADLASAKSSIDVDLRARAPQIQQLADRVAQLNADIGASAGSGGAANDLIDQRQVAIDALAAELGATVVPGDSIAATLVLPGGQTIVSGDRAAKIGVSTSPDGRLLLSLGGTDGAPAKLFDQRDVGGAVGGLLTARDEDIAAAEADLDTFAFDLANAFNAAHTTGIALDGSSGRDLFTVTPSSVGAARALAVSTTIAGNASLLGASSTGATGDAGGVQSLLQVRDTAIAGTTDPFSALANMTAGFGERARSASVDRTSSASLLAHGVNLREGVSGVSIDEELVELQRAERAFQAASKVISTADQMLQTVLDIKK